jgi:hypothetical protein
MAFVAGDIREITYNHPTLGSGTVFPKSGEDFTIDRGGRRSNDDDNAMAGGQRIDQMNEIPWSGEGTAGWDAIGQDELQKFTDMAGDPTEATWTIEHISGAIYSGSGKPVGDIKGNLNTATMAFKLAGSGVLKKIS